MSSQMVLKQKEQENKTITCFRSMSSQMVLKLLINFFIWSNSFRSMSSQMVLKQKKKGKKRKMVLDLCHLKWY